MEWEREKYANNKDNQYVMIVDNTVVAKGTIEGNQIAQVAVRLNINHGVMAKLWWNF
ncbi:hypothetical protein J7E73_05020 [Paenibacillus albidus]|uniref:hypothetical protein n=1 Tax=Paenibacillus albidus TaxID=2041023 RepID=UPI001BE80001|nr:hypothetical protein [Paenibacillus albidus]MBT2288505.1 hypothetical protein [Paenibacillus albidus]